MDGTKDARIVDRNQLSQLSIPIDRLEDDAKDVDRQGSA
jgi:hypothetical protein